MGGAKRELERLNECRAAARTIAVRAGLLEACDTCDDIFDPGSYAFEDAYKLGNALVTRNDPLVAPFQSRREMTDIVKEVGTSAPELCHCEYQMAKDD